MDDRYPAPTGYDSSLGLSVVSRIIQQRTKWIVLGTVIGVVLSISYLLLAPTTYTATARVSITALGSEPVPEGRSLSSVIDIPTERQIASSALTTEGAAEDLGAGWTVYELRKGLAVSGEPTSTVLGISFSATDRKRSIEGANALARAYLVARTSLVTERARAITDMIDERIEGYEKELRGVVGGAGDQADAAVRAETIKTGILALQQRRATWSDIPVQAGQVISPAKNDEVSQTPVLWRVVAPMPPRAPVTR